MLNKLNKDFQFVLRRFQQLAEQSAQHARLEDLEAARQANTSGADSVHDVETAGAHSTLLDEEDDVANERGPLLAADEVAAAEQQQQQQKQKQRQAALAGAEAMAERERMISTVESTVIEVKEIFSELATLVSDQSEQIEHIADAIEVCDPGGRA